MHFGMSMKQFEFAVAIEVNGQFNYIGAHWENAWAPL